MLRLRGMRNSDENAHDRRTVGQNDENAPRKARTTEESKAARRPLSNLSNTNSRVNNVTQLKKRPLDNRNVSEHVGKVNDPSLGDRRLRPRVNGPIEPDSQTTCSNTSKRKSSRKKSSKLHATRDLPQEPDADKIHRKTIYVSPPSPIREPEIKDGNDAVNSLFQTGSGKNVAISVAKVKEYEQLWNQEISVDLPPQEESESVDIPSLFQTGRGRLVKISPEAVHKYELQLHDEEENKCVERDEASIVSLFQTGTGKKVKISREKVREYEERIVQIVQDARADEMAASSGIGNTEILAIYSQSHLDGPPPTATSGASAPPQDVNFDTGFNSLDIAQGHELPQVQMNSLFQTGSGRTVKISTKQTEVYERKLFSDDEPISPKSHSGPLQDKIVVRPIPNAQPTANISSSEFVTSMFQTGSGRNVTVSTEKLRCYEEKIQNDTDFITSIQESSQTPTNSTEIIQSPGDDSESVGSLIQTGLGQRIEISAEKLGEYEKKVIEFTNEVETKPATIGQTHIYSPRDFKRPRNRKENADSNQSNISVPSLFQTGSGRTVEVSLESVAKYYSQLQHASEELMADNELHGQHGTHLAKSRKSTDDHIDITPLDTTSTNIEPTVTSIFQTSRGNAIRIPVSKVKKYEQLVRHEMSETGGSSANHEHENKHHEPPDETHPSRLLVNSSQAIESHKEQSSYNTAHYNYGSPQLISSLFQTGSGRNVSILAENVKAYELRFENDKEELQQCDGPSLSTQTLACATVQVPGNTEISVEKLNRKVSGRANEFIDENNSKGEKSSTTKKPPITASESLSTKLTNNSNCAVGIDSNYNVLLTTNEENEIDASFVKKPVKTKLSVATAKRDARTFRPPRAMQSLPPTSTKAPLPKCKAVFFAASQFPVQVLEVWKFDLLSSCPSAFSKNPFKSAIQSISAENAHAVSFDHLGKPHLEFQDGFVAATDLYNYMVSLKFLVPAIGATPSWFKNHFRWIVLKCASMERVFVPQLFGKYCTQAQVASQISRRHLRELEKSERPILKKVYERDTHAGNAMVLFVAAAFESHWILSDGWYGIAAVPDTFLAGKGSEVVGSKLVIWNSALLNNPEGINPLDAPVNQSDETRGFDQFDVAADPYLIIHANSTRRVHWKTKLGVETPHFLLRSLPLRSLKQDGGLVRSIRCVILRSSDILFLQPKENTQGPRVLSDKVIHQLSPDAVTSSTPFMRLKVACSHGLMSGAQNHSVMAVLTIWRPNEETQLVCKEGMEVYATGLAVSWKQQELSLSSSKHSTFMRTNSLNLENAQAFVGYEPRSCLSVRDIQHMAGQEVDACVYIIYVSHDYAFATDQSLKLVSIKLPHWGRKAWKNGATFCLRNLFVSHFDQGLGVLDCTMTEMSTLSKSPTKSSYFASTFHNLKADMETKKSEIDTLMEYIKSSILHQTAYDTSSIASTQEKLTVIVGHPMHLYLLPHAEANDVAAILYIDEGSQVVEVSLTPSLANQASNMLNANDWLQLIRVSTRLQIEDSMTNSCRSWEAFGSSCRLIATQIDILSTSERMQSLFRQVQ
ncbi:Aste57867_8928 [Aphanomyces stellatus]|uniref:Aste57867_8928 protein n=1 Tax=Aphanomyces stellatus TaxID=120398 RepID=A0A485KLN8_9STRA|nr:hypothetical protein As57867_008893 [Aphanomyces stellatus]VFT85812.1 Aste57867_8928 [Aphanomyces stellatus]